MTQQTRRIQTTDSLGNRAYIHRTSHGWRCTLANGMPATMWYAVGDCDEMALKFRLADAATDQERLRIVQDAAGPHRRVEFFG